MTQRPEKKVNSGIELPEKAYTVDGVEFYPRKDSWRVVCTCQKLIFNFNSLNSLPTEMLANFKAVLLFYLENKSGMHANNMFQRFRHFIKSIQKSYSMNHITVKDIINYKAMLPNNRSWYLSALSGFLQKWHALGYSGIDDDVVALLKQVRLKGNHKGEAVVTMDPEAGPFSDLELEAVHHGINETYAEGRITLDEFVLVWLYSAIGARSVQYAALKIKDFVSYREKDGTSGYILRMPSAKKRNALPRSSFKDRKLIPQIGEAVQQHKDNVLREYRDSSVAPDDLPLFPTDDDGDSMPGFQFHKKGQELNANLQNILNKVKAMSERTGHAILISSRRFRYTLGTRAAMEGAGELVIADLLDHIDTQNAGVYVKMRPEIIERIDKAVSMQLAPLAQAFCGIIVSDENEAIRGSDLSSRVIYPQSTGSIQPMGTCGKYGFCAFAAPIACYTCRNFQPWLEGPHEAVLDRLIEERDRIKENTGDLRIASVNDRTILAVAEVVRRCKEITTEREKK